MRISIEMCALTKPGFLFVGKKNCAIKVSDEGFWIVVFGYGAVRTR